MIVIAKRFENKEDAFLAQTTVVESGCTEWTGPRNDQGYGLLAVEGGRQRAHRYAWERSRGPIPEGMVVDHLCWNRACVNVDHLRVITMAANQQNRQGANRRSKSGLRGISWDATTRQWRVRVFADGKTHWGGRYADKNEAAQVAAEMRAKLQPFSQN